MEDKTQKGDFLGQCYRMVCKNEPAEWYNHSTRKYYCHRCAFLINDANYKEAREMFGHDLCTLGEHNTTTSL
jgi:hypothetical protein